MFCPKCGTQNNDDAAFCAQCGGALRKGEDAPAAASGNSIPNASKESAPKKAGSKKTKLIVAIVAVVAIIAVIVGVVVSCSGGGKGLLEGVYKKEYSQNSYSATTSMDITQGNEVTFTRVDSGHEEKSISGIYEFTSSVDGNNVYTIKDLKLSDGRAPIQGDVEDTLGFYGVTPDHSIDSIAVMLPKNYENGDIEGRWGILCSGKRPDGQTGFTGTVAIFDSDGSGAAREFTAQGDVTPDVVFADTDVVSTNYKRTFKVTKNAPGSYTLTWDATKTALNLTFPVKEK